MVKLEMCLEFNMSNDTAKFIARLSWEKVKYYNYQGCIFSVSYCEPYQTDRISSIEKDGLRWQACDGQHTMPIEFHRFKEWNRRLGEDLAIMVPGWKHVQYN